MTRSDIITGQYVTLRQSPASVGDRLLAHLIDLIALISYESAMFFMFDKLSGNFEMSHPYLFYPALFVLMVIPLVLYHPLCEWLNRGQSIGKTVLHCRVVTVDGSTPTLSGYLMRWLLYPIDVLLTGGLGVVVILFTRNNQRFGDLAAGTMVVKTNALDNQRISLNEFFYVQQNYSPTFTDAGNLSLRQVEVISQTLYNVKGDNREHCLDRLTAKVEEYIDCTKPMTMTREDFLYTVLNDYYYYASTIEA